MKIGNVKSAKGRAAMLRLALQTFEDVAEFSDEVFGGGEELTDEQEELMGQIRIRCNQIVAGYEDTLPRLTRRKRK